MISTKISILTEANIPDFLDHATQERGANDWDHLAALAQEMLRGERAIWLAHDDTTQTLCGFITVRWASDYMGFRREPVAPEIVDLYVWQTARRRKIGLMLLQQAENAVAARGYRRIGLGVGILPADMAAWRLYLNQDYQFDGSGSWWKGDPVTPDMIIDQTDKPVLFMMDKHLNKLDTGHVS
jgi:GNAT superfamily N-acetyltransferase